MHKWLYLIVQSELWTGYHATTAYPTAPVHPKKVLNYLQIVFLAENTAIREIWQKTEDADTHKAHIKRCLSLLPQEYRDLYQKTLIQNSNNRFGENFNCFYREYGILAR